MQLNNERMTSTFSEYLSEELCINEIIEKLLHEHDKGVEQPVCEYILKRNDFDSRDAAYAFIDKLPLFEKRLATYFQSYCQDNKCMQEGKEHRLRIKGYYVSAGDNKHSFMSDNLIYIYIELYKSKNRDSISNLYHWEEIYNELRVDNRAAELQRGIIKDDWRKF